MRLLSDPRAGELLGSLPPLTQRDEILRVTDRLRAEGYDAELIAAALTQQRLRTRAAEKFGAFAAGLFFTKDGLEQATRMDVAARHAKRFRQAGCTTVLDLGCGIGAESLALSGIGLNVIAVDADETHAALALLNLRPFDGAEVRHDRIENLDLAATGADGAFADPARRGARGRTFDPESWSPPLTRILAVAETIKNLGVKVAPGIGYEHLPEAAHVQWVDVEGTTVEAGIWLGDLAFDAPGRSALIVGGHGSVTYPADASRPTAPAARVAAAPLGAYIHSVSGAILRAGALSHVAELIGAAGTVSEDIGYLTGERACDLPGVASLRVLDVLPARVKPLAAELRRRDIGALEILKRGIDVDPATLRRQLKLRGTRTATLIMTRVAGRHAAILAQRAP